MGNHSRTEAAAWAGLALLAVHTEPEQAPELLEKALALRDAMQDRYSRAADLANFGAELLRVDRPEQAVQYFEEAYMLLDLLELEALRERVGEKLNTAKSLRDTQG